MDYKLRNTMKRSRIKLKEHSELGNFHSHFGSVTEIPDQSNFGQGIVWDVEQAGEVDCTAESFGKVGTSLTKTVYDHEDLWNHTPHSTNGADPVDTGNVMCTIGLKPLVGGAYDTRWKKPLLRADKGDYDAFDSTRSAMTIANSSSTVNTRWYEEWSHTPPNGILPVGINPISGHSYVAVDWVQINGQPMFLIDSHQGFKQYMPRETYNNALSTWGSSALIPPTEDVITKEKISILLKIRDLYMNLILYLERQFLLKKDLSPVEPTPVPVKPNPINTKLVYDWSTPDAARHSVRLICDDMGLSVADKNLICQVIHCESNFNPKSENKNKDGNGTVLSTDYGICQINDFYHIGTGKDFPSVDFVLHNPENCVRWMIQMFKAGKLSMWVCYKSGMYKNY